MIPFSLVLTKHILLTETPSRLNFTGFQPGLDGVSNVKLRSSKPKKGEVKAIYPRIVDFTVQHTMEMSIRSVKFLKQRSKKAL